MICLIAIVSYHFQFLLSSQLCQCVAGPTVDSNMTLSILSSITDPNIKIALSFNVSFGPPSRIRCTRNNVQVLDGREIKQIAREVIRSRYIDSTLPDITHVMVQLDSQPRVVGVYTCTVTVESRISIANGFYDHDPKGTPGSTTATLTGE